MGVVQAKGVRMMTRMRRSRNRLISANQASLMNSSSR